MPRPWTFELAGEEGDLETHTDAKGVRGCGLELERRRDRQGPQRFVGRELPKASRQPEIAELELRLEGETVPELEGVPETGLNVDPEEVIGLLRSRCGASAAKHGGAEQDAEPRRGPVRDMELHANRGRDRQRVLRVLRQRHEDS